MTRTVATFALRAGFRRLWAVNGHSPLALATKGTALSAGNSKKALLWAELVRALQPLYRPNTRIYKTRSASFRDFERYFPNFLPTGVVSRVIIIELHLEGFRIAG